MIETVIVVLGIVTVACVAGMCFMVWTMRRGPVTVLDIQKSTRQLVRYNDSKPNPGDAEPYNPPDDEARVIGITNP